MSYTIELYSKAFLQCALETQSGDWTNADPLPAAAIEGIVAACLARGFVAQPHPPGFEEFLRQQGSTPGREFVLPGSPPTVHVSVFPGSVAFTVDYSPTATQSIEDCCHLARGLALQFGLGYHDGQADEIDC